MTLSHESVGDTLHVQVGPVTRVNVPTPPCAPNDRVAGASVYVQTGTAALIVTSCCADAAAKCVVAAPLAWTRHVPTPLELNVAPLASVHGPLTTL